MTDFRTILNSQFRTPVPNVELTLLMRLKEWYPTAQHVPMSAAAGSDDDSFPLFSYLSSAKIDADTVHDSGTHKIFGWDAQNKELYADIITGEFKFSYEKTDFLVYKATWSNKHRTFYFYDLIFDGLDDSAGKKLAADVNEWTNSLKEEIWVFQGGWGKSKALYKAIQAASWDDLVLDESFKAGLKRDTDTFFASQEIYDSLGITWKRGILLLGAQIFLHQLNMYSSPSCYQGRQGMEKRNR
jgi:hypothetical protein